MNIYIPTMGRVEQQKTWDRLPAALRANTQLVCPPDEVKEHKARGRFVLPCPAKGIAPVRQWLVEREKGKFCMSDDDHYFFRRVKPAEPKLRIAVAHDLIAMFARIKELLDRYPLVGISARQGNDAYLGVRKGSRTVYEISPGLTLNKRIFNLYGVRADILKREGIRFDAVKLMEDMNVTLSLIARGYDCALITEFCWNQSGSGSKGGCSAYRDAELQKQGSIRLAELHRPYVTVIKKKSITKGAWESSVGEERFDVRVDWTGAVIGRQNAKRKPLF